MQLIQIIYISEESDAFSKEAFRALIASSSKSNTQNAITGALYYGRGHFIQILEGMDKSVIQLYGKIMSDERHKEVRTLAMRPISKRDFEHWGMGAVSEKELVLDAKVWADLNENNMQTWNGLACDDIINSFRQYVRKRELLER